MAIKASEISDLIKSRIEKFSSATEEANIGTVVTVTNLEDGRTVQVVINDRGPFGGRIIDLSNEAFARIAPLSQGVAQVRLAW